MSALKCVIFDLDGTIYFGSRQLAEKANEVINYARKKYGKVFFATNNSALSRHHVYERLCNLGVALQENEVINSSYLMGEYIKQQKITDVWCLGTNDLCEEISQAGIEVKSTKPQAIVIGYDYQFAMKQFEEVLKYYSPECKIIIANMERIYPRDNGILTPGCGAIGAAFLHIVNRTDYDVVGKPSVLMLDTIAKKYDFQPNEILMVGDTYESDIKMAKNYGAQTILITNGQESDFPCSQVKYLKNLLQEI